MNKVILLGRVGRNPKITKYRRPEGGPVQTVANFPLATVTRKRNSEGGMDKFTQWHSIVCWHEYATTAKYYVRKGDKLLLEGRLEYRSWEKRDGSATFSCDIKVVKPEGRLHFIAEIESDEWRRRKRDFATTRSGETPFFASGNPFFR